ncbi:MAG: prepilin-type N-terminal cleavage/methylation domain-containing protein [Bdellovibrionales bacterium]
MISRAVSNRGFTLIEILMVIVLVGILSVVSVEVITDSVDDAKFDETVDEMRAIQYAIVGNPKLRDKGARTSFGYYGDVGALPTSISDLITKPGAVAAYSVNDASNWLSVGMAISPAETPERITPQMHGAMPMFGLRQDRSPHW